MIVKIDGGAIRNSLIARNASSFLAPVKIADGAVMDNCTVISNRNDSTKAYTVNNGNPAVYINHTGGMKVDGSAKVRNTLVDGNWSTKGACVSNLNWTVASGVFTKTVANDRPGLEEYGLLTGRVLLRRNPAYTPRMSAVMTDNGEKLEWMTSGSVDLYGNHRVYRRTPDIGAVENQSGGFAIILR